MLSQTIDRGEAVLASASNVRDDTSFADWTAEATSWRKYATTVLQRISEGEALEIEFGRASRRAGMAVLGGPPEGVASRLERRVGTVRNEVSVLKSVAERLELLDAPAASPQRENAEIGRAVFVVHGRQKDSAEIVARFIEKLGLDAVILDEQANAGRTLIEKFEANSESAGFAVVLLLPDDFGRGPDDADWPEHPNRARQNVILELGYFVGRLGRARVCALVGEAVEQPSDIHGLAYVPFDDSWQLRLLRELKHAYPDLDANKAV